MFMLSLNLFIRKKGSCLFLFRIDWISNRKLLVFPRYGMVYNQFRFKIHSKGIYGQKKGCSFLTDYTYAFDLI